MSSVSMFYSWRVTKKPTVVRCCLENNKRADNENLYLISLNGLCNWISFSERVPGTTGFSLANIITPPPHTRRAFSPRESYCACARARAHIAYSKKLHCTYGTNTNHDIFFPRNYQTSSLGKGKVNRLFMYFFPCASHCDAPAMISFRLRFFFPSTISKYVLRLYTH